MELVEGSLFFQLCPLFYDMLFNQSFTALISIAILLLLCLPCHAYTPVEKYISPSGTYSVVLSPVENGFSTQFYLHILKGTQELACDRLDGEIVSVLWSPTEKYIILNNHPYRLSYFVWIFSLTDGSLVDNFYLKSIDYDLFSYYDSLPIPDQDIADNVMKVYAQRQSDSVGKVASYKGAVSWLSNNSFQVINQLNFTKLLKNDHVILFNSSYKIENSKINYIKASKFRMDYNRCFQEYLPMTTKEKNSITPLIEMEVHYQKLRNRESQSQK